jgi:hypothetical protein
VSDPYSPSFTLHAFRVVDLSFQGSDQPELLGGAFKRTRGCRDLQNTSFSADQKIIHILNLHLQDNAVIRSELAVLRKELREAVKSAAEAQVASKAARKACDSLTSEANKKKTPGSP